MDIGTAHKILIVDDSRSVRGMFSAILTANGYTVVTAENGREALALLDDGVSIDLIMSDVNMPEINGIALVKELHRRELDVPIIMVTSVRTISVAVDALKNGAADYILKDAHIQETISLTVKRALEKHQLILKNQHLEKLVAQEVRKNREKDIVLMQRDKLASIGQLAAGIAHEINNPMGFIISNLETLAKYTDKTGEYLKLLTETVHSCCSEAERIRLEERLNGLDLPYILEDTPLLISESLDGADRVKRIVLDLKDFARIDQNCLIPADLNQCIQSTVNIVRNELKYVADIVLELEELPLVTCFASQINQVVANLLLNAAHAIKTHGTITISTRTEMENAVIKVSDNGIGMSEEIRARIFEPFFTTKEVGKGTGLGLAISNDIISKHGGMLTVESTAGVGSTFTISLPLQGTGKSVRI